MSNVRGSIFAAKYLRWLFWMVLAVVTCYLLTIIPRAQAVDGGITVRSGDMSDNAALNPMFACTAVGSPDGLTSPGLNWSGGAGVPASYALIMHDEFGADQGHNNGADWAHWAVYNISPFTTELPRDASAGGLLGGGTEAVNTWGEMGAPGEERYRGPCPPSGDHAYYFTVYSLDATITPTGTGPGGAVTAGDVLAAMAGHILDQGDLQVSFANQAVGTSRADIEFSGDGADAEAAGGNLPVILVNGRVNVATSVTVSVTGGTATAGEDFNFSSPQTVTIPAGTYDGTVATAISISGLSVANDAVAESDETIVFTLSAPTGDAALSEANHDGMARSEATYTIANDDAALPSGGNNDPGTNSPDAGTSGGQAEAPSGGLSGFLADTGQNFPLLLVVACLLIAAGIGTIALRANKKRNSYGE